VLRFGGDGEAYLASVHPGVQVGEVLAKTGWELRVSDKVTETPAPNEHELAIMRELDPNHFWTR
jgi:glutaconate CoA-transferase subunit B